MSKSKDTTTEIVYDYLKTQNRPYSIIDIFNNLHKEHGKTAIIKAIEQLVEDGRVIEKVYGKQKIFYPNQNVFPQVMEDELYKMDAEINNLTGTLNEILKANKAQEVLLQSLSKSLTLEEVKNRVEDLKVESCSLEKKLSSLKVQAKGIDPNERNEIMKQNEILTKEWRKRKRIANEILDAILEGYPKDKKTLLSEVGIETDEENDVVCPK